MKLKRRAAGNRDRVNEVRDFLISKKQAVKVGDRVRIELPRTSGSKVYDVKVTEVKSGNRVKGEVVSGPEAGMPVTGKIVQADYFSELDEANQPNSAEEDTKDYEERIEKGDEPPSTPFHGLLTQHGKPPRGEELFDEPEEDIRPIKERNPFWEEND